MTTQDKPEYKVVLGGIPQIPYTMVFLSNHFKDIDFQIYQLCWHTINQENFVIKNLIKLLYVLMV